MIWELCDGSSEYLVDLWCSDEGWQAAKKHFRDKGYYGKFLLIHRARNGNFKLYQVNIEKKKGEQYDE